MWTLNSLPDWKGCHQYLEIGKAYEVLKIVGNGFVIQTSSMDKEGNPDQQIVVLQERFSKA